MDLLIISPEKELLNVKNVDLVECDGIEGKFQILKNHADMFSLLKQGEVIYRKENIEEKINLPKKNFENFSHNFRIFGIIHRRFCNLSKKIRSK